MTSTQARLWDSDGHGCLCIQTVLVPRLCWASVPASVIRAFGHRFWDLTATKPPIGSSVPCFTHRETEAWRTEL